MSIQGFVKSLKARRSEIDALLQADKDRLDARALKSERSKIDEKPQLATREKIGG